MPKRFKRGLLALVFSFAMLVVVGAIYQWVSEQRDRKLIPGELVGIDGHEFHLLCRGSGRPLVLLENGLTTAYTDWMATIDAVSEFTEVCTYDRLGLGWSSRNPAPTTVEDVVGNLRELLETSDLVEDVVLVGFSAGGLYVRKYQQQYPERVVGMVLVDSAHEQQALRLQSWPSNLGLVRLCNAVSWSGLVRLLDWLDAEVPEQFSDQLVAEQRALFYRTVFCHGYLQQHGAFFAEVSSTSPPASLGDLPLIVIRAGISLAESRYADQFPEEFLKRHQKYSPQLQQELANLSTHSKLWVAEKSDHSIPVNQPEIIVKAVREMVGRLRAGIGK